MWSIVRCHLFGDRLRCYHRQDQTFDHETQRERQLHRRIRAPEVRAESDSPSIGDRLVLPTTHLADAPVPQMAELESERLIGPKSRDQA